MVPPLGDLDEEEGGAALLIESRELTGGAAVERAAEGVAVEEIGCGVHPVALQVTQREIDLGGVAVNVGGVDDKLDPI